MRLIDGDALKQTFCAECTHTLKCSDCDIDYHFEKLAPTIQQPYFIQLKNIVSNNDFRRIWEDLKHQCENIVLLHEYEQLVYPTQRWIPCSERLPEDGELVLTTIRGIDFIHLRDDETLEDAIERTQKMLRVSCGFLGEDGWYGADGYPEIVKPIAWMPLPEPYKEE